MKHESTGERSLKINHEALMRLVGGVIHGSSGREDDEHPLPPGPWDPVIRDALDRFSISLAVQRLGSGVELNPQPLPPRSAFLVSLATSFINRAALMQDISNSIQDQGEQRGIIVVGGYVSRFIDEICGNGFRLKYPIPGPRPHWFSEELRGVDLVLMATQFEQAALQASNEILRQSFAAAGAKLVEVGISRI